MADKIRLFIAECNEGIANLKKAFIDGTVGRLTAADSPDFLDALYYDDYRIIDNDNILDSTDSAAIAAAGLKSGINNNKASDIIKLSSGINARRRSSRDLGIALSCRQRFMLSAVNSLYFNGSLLKQETDKKSEK